MLLLYNADRSVTYGMKPVNAGAIQKTKSPDSRQLNLSIDLPTIYQRPNSVLRAIFVLSSICDQFASEIWPLPKFSWGLGERIYVHPRERLYQTQHLWVSSVLHHCTIHRNDAYRSILS